MRKFNINIDIEHGDKTFSVRALGYPKQESTGIESIDILSIKDEDDKKIVPTDDQMSVFRERCFEMLYDIDFNFRNL